jgi:toxin-antitoxin system PIN domain toxin
MTWLLDGNVLIAMSLPDHPHHDRAHGWLNGLDENDEIATCPVTEGTLLRLHMRYATDTSAEAAWATLEAIHAHPRHVPWETNFSSYTQMSCERLTKQAQLTDALLAELARRHEGRVATMDAEFALLHDDVTTLLSI